MVYLAFGLGALVGFFFAAVTISLICMAGRPSQKPYYFQPIPKPTGAGSQDGHKTETAP